MPAPALITEAEILAAGRDLAARGRPVTGWGIRGQTKRGDPERLMAVWLAAQVEPGAGAPGEQPAPVAVPGALAERVDAMKDAMAAQVDTLTGSLWTIAERLAAERFGAEAEAARAQAAHLQQQLDDAGPALAEADAAREQAEQDAEVLRARLAEVEREADQRVQAAEQRAAVAEARHADAMAEVERGRGEAERARAEFSAALAALKTAR